MTAGDRRKSCIDVAAEFVAAQPDGPRRLLALHHRRDDGNCAGCFGANPWPCTHAIIGGLAARLPGPGRDHDGDHPATGPGSG